jgi:hypothetical protein
LIRISFAKKIKPLLEKIEEIVTQKSKPLSSKGTALPKDSRGKIKPAGIMLKSGERNFSVMQNNLKEFREAFGEFSTKQILLSYNISLLTAENRKKLLDEYRRFLNFKAPELFADGQVYNSLKDIRAALVKQSDEDSLNNELSDWIWQTRLSNKEVRVAIKGDQLATNKTIKKVIATLQDRKVNRFNFITAMERAAD